jgi:hypothetical protein
MKREQIKYLLDFIPSIILLLYSTELVADLLNRSARIEPANITGLAVLPVIFFLLVKKHKAGVLLLGLVLLLSVIGLFSFSVGYSAWKFGIGNDRSGFSFRSPGNPLFILYFILHTIFSGRYYTGILTRKYWREM